MSLVDYDASSSDEEEEEVPIKNPETTSPESQPSVPIQNISKPNDQSESPILKLPDASELLNSSDFSSAVLAGGGAHSGFVGPTLARKRDLAGPSSVELPRVSKLPKGQLPHSKNVPDTAGQMLVPPQLKGRSNVVTEDITKLFVKKKVDPSSKQS